MTRRKFFICYRRRWSAAHARSIQSAISEQFGENEVFLDTDDIDTGVDFRAEIQAQLDMSVALIVVIGRNWLVPDEEQDGGGLHNPSDYVRREIQYALDRGIEIIPILFDGAHAPKAHELPQEFADFARLEFYSIREGRLAEDIEGIIVKLRAHSKRSDVLTRKNIVVVALACSLLVALSLIYKMVQGPLDRATLPDGGTILQPGNGSTARSDKVALTEPDEEHEPYAGGTFLYYKVYGWEITHELGVTYYIKNANKISDQSIRIYILYNNHWYLWESKSISLKGMNANREYAYLVPRGVRGVFSCFSYRVPNGDYMVETIHYTDNEETKYKSDKRTIQDSKVSKSSNACRALSPNQSENVVGTFAQTYHILQETKKAHADRVPYALRQVSIADHPRRGADVIGRFFGGPRDIEKSGGFTLFLAFQDRNGSNSVLKAGLGQVRYGTVNGKASLRVGDIVKVTSCMISRASNGMLIGITQELERVKVDTRRDPSRFQEYSFEERNESVSVRVGESNDAVCGLDIANSTELQLK